MKTTNQLTITAHDVRDVKACSAKIAGKLLQFPAHPSPTASFLARKGQEFEDRVLTELFPVRRPPTGGNQRRRVIEYPSEYRNFRAVTNRLRTAPVGTVLIQPPLRVRFKKHVYLTGRPDFLLRTEAGWMVVDVKSHRPFVYVRREQEGLGWLKPARAFVRRPARPRSTPLVKLRPDDQVQLEHYRQILTRLGVQVTEESVVIGPSPDGGQPIAAGGVTNTGQWETAVGEILTIAKNPAGEYRPWYTSSVCRPCKYRRTCVPAVLASRSASLAGISRREAESWGRDLLTLARRDLSAADGRERISIIRARSRLAQRPLVITPDNSLPASPNAWDVDIEDEFGVPFLLGMLDGSGQYRYWATNPLKGWDGARDLYLRFWSAARRARPDVVFHYGHHEVAVLDTLDPSRPFTSLPTRDVHRWLTSTVALPGVTGYGLKDVAQSLGFAWRVEDPAGSWLLEWVDGLRKQDVDPNCPFEQLPGADFVLTYNEDDLRAQRHVRQVLSSLVVRRPGWSDPERWVPPDFPA